MRLRGNWDVWLVLAVATFLRFYKLGTLPPGLYPDEAANGLDIISMIEHGRLAAVYDTNGPREALFLYCQGLFVWFGAVAHIPSLNFTPLALRIAPAIIGVLTVWGLFLLGQELFGRNVGLFAAAALAVGSWHIQFSRNGFRAIMVPLALTFLFYFLAKAYREDGLKYYVASGVTLALGFYTYLSFRATPLVLVALLIFVLREDRHFFAKHLRHLWCMFSAFLIAMVPMLIHFSHVPADMLGRSSTSIFNSALNQGRPLATFLDGVARTALMFNVHGDDNFRHNLGGTPMLDPIAGVFFVIGVAVVLTKVDKIEYFLLPSWFVALALPALLTAEGIPHALRMVGVIPVVFLCVGIALEWILTRFRKENCAAVALVGLLVFSGACGYHKYFVEFPSHSAAGEAYAENMVSIARDINAANSDRRNILIVGEYEAKTVEFITHSTRHNWERYDVGNVGALRLDGRNYKIFVDAQNYDDDKAALQSAGIYEELAPVRSPTDARIIYYAYEAH